MEQNGYLKMTRFNPDSPQPLVMFDDRDRVINTKTGHNYIIINRDVGNNTAEVAKLIGKKRGSMLLVRNDDPIFMPS